MKLLVNRHRRTEYNKIRLEALSELRAEVDRIASMILAVAHSRANGDTSIRQNLIQMDCVAACFVKRYIWIASNCVDITEEDINNALGKDYNGTTVWVVVNGDGHIHAEMQLVEELQCSYHVYRGRHIGVSKPCCKQCAEILDELGMKYLYYHEDRVRNWESPTICNCNS